MRRETEREREMIEMQWIVSTEEKLSFHLLDPSSLSVFMSFDGIFAASESSTSNTTNDEINRTL